MMGEEPERGWATPGPRSGGSVLGARQGVGGDGVVALGVVSGIALSVPLWAMIITAVLKLVS